MGKILSITHAEDPDGILAGAILSHAVDPDTYLFARYDRITEIFEEAISTPVEYDHIYVADINVNAHTVGSDDSVVARLAQRGPVTWFDHHDGTFAYKEQMQAMGINVIFGRSCGAKIAQGYFKIDDPYLVSLANIAKAHDHRSTTEDMTSLARGDELQKIIGLANETLDYDKLQELAVGLRNRGVFDANWNLIGTWKDMADEFDLRVGEEKAKFLETIKTFELGPYTVAAGLASALLALKPGLYHLRDNVEADMHLCVFRSPARNPGILNKSNFPLAQLGKNLGGGGRDDGIGFALDYDVSEDNFDATLEWVIDEMKKLL